MTAHSGAVVEYLWKPLSELPPPDQGKSHDRDALYEKHVGGKAILPPLEAALAFFDSMREQGLPDVKQPL